MSDTATPTPTTPPAATPAAAPAATPEPAPPQPGAAPAGAEAPQPTPTPAEGTEGPRQPQSAAEAKQALRRGKQYPSTAAEAKQALAQPRPEQHHSQEQPRAEDGKFAATQSGAADAASPEPSAAPEAPDPNAAAAPAPDATPPDAAATPQAAEPAAPDATGTAEVPEGMVRIDIPEGHPMRHRGDHYLVPAGHEEYHRWAVNNTIRRNDVEAAAKNTREWQQYANRLKAELDATREFAGGIFQDPAVIQQIDDIRKTYGDEAAKRFEAGLWAEQQGKVQELTQQQQAEAAQAERAQIVQGFMQQAHAAAQKRYPEWSQQEVDNALAAYGSWVEARSGGNASAQELKLNEFLSHADPVYLQNPRARATAEQRRNQRLEQERQNAAKKEAERLKAEEQKRLEEAAAQRAQYPWMRVPANAVPAQVGVDEGAGGPRTVQEAKRSLTRRGRQRVA